MKTEYVTINIKEIINRDPFVHKLKLYINIKNNLSDDLFVKNLILESSCYNLNISLQ